MRHLMTTAAGWTGAVVRAIRPDQFGNPTPCANYDVRTLVNHLFHWGASYAERAARKAAPPPGGPDDDRTGRPDWAEEFARQAELAARAWSAPDAWTGTSHLAGRPMPAELVGSLLSVELVLHGWDLAVATGQPTRCPPELASATLDIVTRVADHARANGAFGDAVPVAESAPPLSRALALSGRDPDWSPGRPGTAAAPVGQLTSSAQARQSSSTP